MTKGTLYHIAIDDQGYLLSGTPTKPARQFSDAAKLGENPSNIDLSFADASQWFPWAQTDWSGGFQEEKWQDTASFKYGSNVDASSVYGQLTLQPDVVAVKTNFSSGHTYGAHIVTNQKLIVGTKHATTSQIWQFDTDNTAVNLFAGFGGTVPPEVRDFDTYQGLLLTAASGSANTLTSYDWNGSFTAISGFGAGGKRMVKVIGERIYAGCKSSAGYGDVLKYSDDGGATATSILDFSINKNNRHIIKGAVNYGTLYFFVQDGNSLELWKCQDIYPEKIYTWSYLTNPDMIASQGILHISGEDEEGNVLEYSWTGAQMLSNFRQTIDAITMGSQRFVENAGNLLLEGISFDGEFWFSHIQASISGGSSLKPFASFGPEGSGRIYFYGTGDDGALDIYSTGDGYASTGYAVTGIYTADKPAVNKLWHSAEIDFKALEEGESIEVLYSIDNEATWTSLGTASFANEGAVSKKTLYFPAATSSRQIQLKIVLNGDGSSTPTLYDFVVRFRPMGDDHYQVGLLLKCLDNMTLLNDVSKEPKRGLELRNKILAIKETKSIVKFEDIDYFETTLNGNINSASTIINVASTADAPEIGRFRVDNEWITYKGKTATSFTGCVRGARGATQSSHNSGAKVSNIYDVLIVGYSETLPVLNDLKSREFYVQIKLIEV